MSTYEAQKAKLGGQRLSKGKCPEHGVMLVKSGAMLENNVPVGTTYKCPNAGCNFTTDARAGHGLTRLIR